MLKLVYERNKYKECSSEEYYLLPKKTKYDTIRTSTKTRLL